MPKKGHRKDAGLPDGETIVGLYKDGKSAESIANRCDLGKSTIRRRLKEDDDVTMRTRGEAIANRHENEYGDRLWRDKSTLRKLYIQDCKSASEIAEIADTGLTTIMRWLRRHGIDVRPVDKATKMANKVPWAYYFTNERGYEWLSSPHHGNYDQVQVSQLVAISDGEDPYEVFAPQMHVHHGNDGNPRLPMCEIPWANWFGNLQLMTASEHGSHHNKKAKDEDLLAEIRRLKRVLGREPETGDMNEQGAYHSNVYRTHFGSWENAKENALDDR